MMEFNLQPQGTMRFAEHLGRIGTLRNKPKAWTDYYLPVAHDLSRQLTRSGSRGHAIMTALLDVRGVTLRYKTPNVLVTATERVSFQVETSDRFVLLGPSGCGKSTLLKAVGGYLHPSEGEIRIKDRVVKEPAPTG